MLTLKTIRPVIIQWLDAYSEDGVWEEVDELMFEKHLQISIGYPLRVDDYYVMLGSTLDPSATTCFQAMVIPLGMIRSVIEVVGGEELFNDEDILDYIESATYRLSSRFEFEKRND